MAKISKTEAQKYALKTIVADIKVLDTYNKLCNESVSISVSDITIVTGNSKTTITVDRAVTDGIIEQHRKKLVSEIRTLSRKYNIVLDEKDETVINNKAVSGNH